MDSLAVEDNRDAAASGGKLSPEEIVGLLVLEPVEADLFRDHGVPGETGRLFGGQVAAQALAAYLSDLTLASTTVRPTSRHPRGRRDVTGVTSLDHSLWFHHRPDLSDWLLYAKTAPAVGPARGLSTGHIFDRHRTLIASVAQEVLLHAHSRT